jgi:hypothetical protein
MYLELFHGRTTADQQMDDWGLPGPIIGPLQYAHTTYASDLKFGFVDKSKSDGWLTVVDGLIYYDRVFDGDWSTFNDLPEDQKARIVEFHQTKAKAPTPAEPRSTEDNLANILTALNGFAFLAQQNAGDPAKAQEYLQQLVEAADRAARLYRQYHVLRLHGAIEPQIIGPFDTEAERDLAAQLLRRENDEDVILALNGPGSSVEIEAYSAGFLNQQSDEEN